MKLYRFLISFSVVLIAGLSGGRAQNGAWDTTSSSADWNVTGSWVNGVIADGAGNTADFSQVNPISNLTVTLGTSRTIGTLDFGDTDKGSDASWILSGTGTLTLGGASPVIRVDLASGEEVRITLPLSGTSGFTKTGTERLRLDNGSNAISGPILIQEGTLQSTGSTSFMNVSGPVTVSSGATFYYGQSFSGNDLTNDLNLSGAGTDGKGALHMDSNAVSTGSITLNADTKISHRWNNATVEGSVTGSNVDLTLESQVETQGPLSMDGPVSLGAGTLIKTGPGEVRLNASNSFSSVAVNDGLLYFEQSAAMGGSGATILIQQTGVAARNVTDLNTLLLRTDPASAGAIAFRGSGSGSTALDLTGYPSLSMGSTHAFTYSGTVTPANGAYRFGGGGGTFTVSSPLSGSNGVIIHDAQGGTVALTGSRTYTGGTTVNAGILQVDGTLDGAVTVADGGSLAPGPVSGIGSLTVSQALAVDGDLQFRIDRSGTQKADLLTVPSLAMNGSLTVVNTGAALQAGDSFTLLSVSGGIRHNGLALNLPALDAGLTWDLGHLISSGVLSVAVAGNTIGYPDFPDMLPDQLEDVYNAGFSSATINPGTYDLPDRENYRSSFYLDGWSNFTINADNVILVVGKNRAFQLNDCNHVTIRGATIRARYPSTTQGRVLSKGTNPDGSAFAMWQISEGFPTAFSTDDSYVPTGNESRAGHAINAVDGTTRIINHAIGDTYGCILTPQGNRTWKVDFNGRTSLPFEVNDWLVSRLESSMGQSHAVFLSDSFNCTIESVTSQSGGFATFFESGGGGNQLIDCTIESSPIAPPGGTETPVVSCSADGVHARNAFPGIRIEGLLTTGVLLDDCIAIHGFFHEVTAVSGNTITVSSLGELKVNDPVRISHDGGFFDQVTCTGITDLGNGSYDLTLDQSLPIPIGSRVANPKYDGDGFRILNCTLGNTRSRAVITKADNGVISGTTITHSGTAVSLGSEYYWNESGYNWNVVVENNVITDCRRGVFINADGAMGNENIFIRNNRFGTMLEDEAIEVEGTNGLEISGNQFGVAAAYEIISLEMSANITLFNNLVAYQAGSRSMIRDRGNVTNLVGEQNGILYSGLPYALTNSLSSLLLVAPFSNSAGDEVQQYTASNASGRWIFQPDGNGFARIVSAASGLVLGVGGSSTGGDALVLEVSGAGDGQLWTLKPVGTTAIELVNKLSGFSANIANNNPQDIVTQETGTSASGQQWTLSNSELLYAAWAGNNGASSDPLADDDLDGLINRIEYALNTDPTQQDSISDLIVPGLISVMVEGEPKAFLTISFKRQVEAADLHIRVETSTNLIGWTADATLVDSIPNADGTHTERWRLPVTFESPAGFLRAVFEQATGY